jgi:predicted RNA-binding protein YlxR (DUF448 family)
MRSCVVCREKQAKKDLLRVVRTPEGETKVDASGKINGRGAYICADGKHWQEKSLRGRLEQALKATLTGEDVTRLIREASTEVEA